MRSRAIDNRSRGQALVEFALIFPVMVVVLFGVFDFGRAIYAYNTISNAARQGVRVAIVNQNAAGTGCAGGNGSGPQDPTKMSAVDCAISAGIALGTTTSNVTITYMNATDTATCSPLAQGCLAVVTVTYKFVPITPVIGSIIGSIPMSSTSKQPVEFVCPDTGQTICNP
jgi:Flp pilus assembly protein TadG